MMHAYATIDTETSTMFNKELPDTADGQPRLASLSIVRASPTWATQNEHTFYVKPDGWEMHPDATAVNGLTTEWLTEHGTSVMTALQAFCACVAEGRVICGYNVGFDLRVIRAELERHNMPLLIDETLTLCAMQKCIGVVKKKDPETGRIIPPKLSEALAHFKIPQYGAHTSLGDAIGAQRILHQLSTIGVYLEPKTIGQRRQPKPQTQEEMFEISKPKKQKRKPAAGPSWLRPETLD